MNERASTSGPPLVTVGMPVYNGERWLAESIESLLRQTFTDFWLVIADNASTDGTQDLCEGFARDDARVKYYRSAVNVGLFRNYDRVFELSASKYFKWASSNDICQPQFLEKCVAVLEARPDVVLACPRTALFDARVDAAVPYEDGVDLQDELPSERIRKLFERLRLNNFVNGVMRSDALRRTALNKVYTSSDINLVAELVLQGKLVQLPERLFYRRINSAAATATLKTREARAAYFEHDAGDVYALGRWKMETGFFAGLWRARIAPVEKLKIYRLLLRRLRHSRRELLGELRAWLSPRRAA